MWFRVDDSFLTHPKVMAAAVILGGERHIGRVAAVWLEAGLYASHHLTDGFVPSIIVRGFRTDRHPESVMEATAQAGLFRKHHDGAQPGYQFHEWDHYQPSSREVKDKRARDRQRKATGKPSANGARSLLTVSVATIDGIVLESADVPSGIRSESKALARAHDPVLDPVPQDQEHEVQRVYRRATPVRIGARQWHLHAAFHALIDSGSPYVDGNGQPVISEISEQLKTIAAQYLGARWDHTRELDKIINAAIARRWPPQRLLTGRRSR